MNHGLRVFAIGTEGLAAIGNTSSVTWGLCVIAAMGMGCSDSPTVQPVPDLPRAIDMNPDPNIVEVSLVAVNATTEYVAGTRTQVLAYRDGSVTGSEATVPGPMIEARQGDRLIVHFRNELGDRPTSVHWHGLRLPIDMDGVEPIEAGDSFDFDFVIQDAGLFWYHPHVETDEQIELGLQGTLLVHGASEPAIAVERTFVLDDVDLEGDTVRIVPSHEDLVLGRRGDTLLVNGKAPGSISASAGSVERWRIVNTSNGRFFDLRLDGLPLRVIGWDGGLIPEPYDVQSLVIAPGERYDIAVALDRASGSSVLLDTRELQRGHDGTDPQAGLVRVDLDAEPITRDALPSAGPSIASLPVTGQSTARRFALSEQLEGPAGAVFLINGQRWPLNTPVDVRLGDVEVFEIVNEAEAEHPVHMHGHFVQVLDHDGVRETQLGWKDTVIVDAKSTVRAAIQYEEPGRWMFHCQIPEHAERGMTADINVQP